MLIVLTYKKKIVWVVKIFGFCFLSSNCFKYQRRYSSHVSTVYGMLCVKTIFKTPKKLDFIKIFVLLVVYENTMTEPNPFKFHILALVSVLKK